MTPEGIREAAALADEVLERGVPASNREWAIAPDHYDMVALAAAVKALAAECGARAAAPACFYEAVCLWPGDGNPYYEGHCSPIGLWPTRDDALDLLLEVEDPNDLEVGFVPDSKPFVVEVRERVLGGCLTPETGRVVATLIWTWSRDDDEAARWDLTVEEVTP